MNQFSLLWPQGQPTATWQMPAETIRDLELEAVVTAMCAHAPHRKAVRSVVYRLCLEPETIRYRQAVLADLQAQPQLAATLRSLLPLLDELALFTYRQPVQGNTLQEVVARAGELELLVDAVHRLKQAYRSVSSLQSGALQALREYVWEITGDARFQQMAEDLPDLMVTLRTGASITIGVNLDEYMRPDEAVLLSVNDHRFTESTLLDRLLGKGAAEGKGIARLHSLPIVRKSSGMITGGVPTDGPPQRVDPLMVPLFKDLSDVLEKVTQPIAQELKKYVQWNGRFLADLRPEIIFYVHALELIQKLEAAGMAWCCPEIAPMEERVCDVRAAYNLQLAIQRLRDGSGGPPAESVVANDIRLGEEGRIAILTGPNQGGKTTYMQGVGLVQVLAQIGMPIPGEAGRISPVDGIYTHYPVEERLELGTGRFGDEARRVRVIFEEVTRYSLVLLNESLATTNMGESVYLARDIVRVLRQIGLRAIFTTHLHDLAASTEKINAGTEGDSLVVSLVASPIADEPQAGQEYSYRVQARPPMGRSYAEHIATQHGISHEQLQALLEERDLLFADGQSRSLE